VLNVARRRADDGRMTTRQVTWALAALALLGAAALSRFVSDLGDYPIDAAAPLDHLAAGNLSAFLADQPLMGVLSLLLRAPAVALARALDGDTLAEYRAGSFVCLAAAGALGVVLGRRIWARDATFAGAALVALLVVAGPVTYTALRLGHPEEPLGAALCVAAVLAARDRRPLLAGVLLGLALATKQWAILALAPAVLAAPASRVRLAGVAVAVAALLTLPPMLANLGDYMEMQKMAAGAGGRVFTQNLWWPFAPTLDRAVFDGVTTVTDTDRHLPGMLIRIPHPLLVIVGFALSALYWRRAGERQGLDPLALLALVFLVRCLLDPVTNDYYHAPFLLALLAWEVERRRGLPVQTLLASAAVWSVWRQVAMLDVPALTNAVYLAWALPVAVLLAVHAFGLPAPRALRAVRSRRGEPARA
jgi:hypothetical protein